MTLDDTITVTLDWRGPLADHTGLPEEPGLYAVSGRVYGGSGTQLLYVGEAKSGLASRWTCAKHRDWLRRHAQALEARLYYAVVPEAFRDSILDIETIFIYLHQPNQNTSKLNSRLPDQRFVIHNSGERPPGLLAKIDTSLSWFGLPGERHGAGGPD